MAFRVQYLLLADAVQEMPNGKVNILGTFDTVFAQQVPMLYPGAFAVVAFLVAQNEDDLGVHQLDIRILRPNDQEAVRVGGVLDCKANRGVGPLMSARIVVAIAQLPIRELGTHRVSIVVDGAEIAHHPLYVANPPAPVAPAGPTA